MNRRSDHHHSEWAELLRGARLAGVAVISAVATAAAVIAGGRALIPVETQPAQGQRPEVHIITAR